MQHLAKDIFDLVSPDNSVSFLLSAPLPRSFLPSSLYCPSAWCSSTCLSSRPMSIPGFLYLCVEPARGSTGIPCCMLPLCRSAWGSQAFHAAYCWWLLCRPWLKSVSPSSQNACFRFPGASLAPFPWETTPMQCVTCLHSAKGWGFPHASSCALGSHRRHGVVLFP